MEFKKYKMEDISTFSQGKQVEIENQYTKQFDNMKRFLRIIDFTNPNEPLRYVEDYGNRYYVTKEDLVMIRYGSQTCGKVVIGKEGIIANNMFKINLDNSIVLNRYAYYFLKQDLVYNYLRSSQNSSTMPSINFGILNKLEIEIPNLDNQRKIVKVLCNIDQKIESNNKINNNLYEMSLSIFNDFLNNNDAELVKLEDCVEKINTGADAIQRAPIVDYDTGVRCIRIGDMTNSRDYHNWGFTKMNDKDYDNYKLIKNDIVITRTAVNGLTYIITDEERVVCNNGNIRLRVNNKYNPLYIYLNTKTKDFRNYIDRINGETSVRPNMKVEYFTSYEIKKYSPEEQNKICNVIKPLFNKINENKKENYNLEQLRDTLLPKLMNGEIDLDNIEL